MPCHQINLMSVKIEAADRNLLEQALQKLKLKYTRNGRKFVINVGSQTITINENSATLPISMQNTLNDIKQQYSKEVVMEAASQYGWTIFGEESEETGHSIVLRRY